MEGGSSNRGREVTMAIRKMASSSTINHMAINHIINKEVATIIKVVVVPSSTATIATTITNLMSSSST